MKNNISTKMYLLNSHKNMKENWNYKKYILSTVIKIYNKNINKILTKYINYKEFNIEKIYSIEQ